MLAGSGFSVPSVPSPTIMVFSADKVSQIKLNWKIITIGLFEQSSSLVGSPVPEIESGEAMPTNKSRETF